MLRPLLQGMVLAVLLGLSACDGTGSPTPPPPTAEPSPPPVAATPDATPGDAPDPRAPAPAPPPWTPNKEDPTEAEHPLENPAALTHFYDALARVDDGKQEVIRVVHLGASMIGMDDLTSVLREKFQVRFGDGGAGLVMLRRYMTNYLHRWVKLESAKWDHCYIGYLCDKAGHYGLGGVAFFGSRGARTAIKTRKAAPGNEAAHYEVWYAAEPGGAKFEVSVDDGEPQVVDTAAEALEDRWHTIDVEQAPHEITMQVKGNGRVRAYGIAVETAGPGIVWDQFSWLGAFTKRMHGWDAEHIAGQVKHRDPALVAFMYGGNDLRRVSNGKLDQARYADEYLQGVKNVMAGKPDASCLIVGITDRGRSLKFEIKPKHVEVIVAAQRDVAKRAGCAFFDTYAAMGGGGSLRKWRDADPPLAAKDLKHLNHAGRELLGGWIYDAILTGYIAHRTG
ncbi:MAG: GDSL-type esterase/lipase family protein [Myxococcota bacterium]